MKCPNCGNWISNQIIDSRPNENHMKRRRRYECPKCKEKHPDTPDIFRFSTVELHAEARLPDAELVEENRELRFICNYLIPRIDEEYHVTDTIINKIRTYIDEDFGKE